MISRLLMLSLMLAQVACVAVSPVSPDPERMPSESSAGITAPALPKLDFIDLATFDHSLARSLRAELATVEVHFLDQVSPNAVPERLQKWLSSLEAQGGLLKVEPPPGDARTRNPMALFSLIGSLISGIRQLNDWQVESVYSATKGHDAVLSLARLNTGALVIDKISFVRQLARP